jgi:hypothetical protein
MPPADYSTCLVCCPRSFSVIGDQRAETPVQRPLAVAVGGRCMMRLTRILMFPFFFSQHHGSAAPTSRCLPKCPENLLGNSSRIHAFNRPVNLVEILRSKNSATETIRVVAGSEDKTAGRWDLSFKDPAAKTPPSRSLGEALGRVPRPCHHTVLTFHAQSLAAVAGGWHDSKGGTCEAERQTGPKKHEYQTRLQAAARPPRADPGEAHGTRDRGGVHRRLRVAAIAARSRAGRNSAADRDHRRHRIRWSGSRRWAGDYSDDAATVSRRAAARSANPRGRRMGARFLGETVFRRRPVVALSAFFDRQGFRSFFCSGITKVLLPGSSSIPTGQQSPVQRSRD